MNQALIADTDVYVVDDNAYHIMLRIGSNEYDISELVFADPAVGSAIESLEAVEIRAI